MKHITKEEILKLAKAANIEVPDEEIPSITQRLEEVLSYASYLKDVAQECGDETYPKLENVVRDDVVKTVPVEPLLERAPDREGDFFVVPVIVKQQ